MSANSGFSYDIILLNDVIKVATIYSIRTGICYETSLYKTCSYFDMENLTFKEIAYLMNSTENEIKEIATVAYDKLRHPFISKKIYELIDDNLDTLNFRGNI